MKILEKLNVSIALAALVIGLVVVSCDSESPGEKAARERAAKQQAETESFENQVKEFETKILYNGSHPSDEPVKLNNAVYFLTGDKKHATDLLVSFLRSETNLVAWRLYWVEDKDGGNYTHYNDLTRTVNDLRLTNGCFMVVRDKN